MQYFHRVFGMFLGGDWSSLWGNETLQWTKGDRCMTQLKLCVTVCRAILWVPLVWCSPSVLFIFAQCFPYLSGFFYSLWTRDWQVGMSRGWRSNFLSKLESLPLNVGAVWKMSGEMTPCQKCKCACGTKGFWIEWKMFLMLWGVVDHAVSAWIKTSNGSVLWLKKMGIWVWKICRQSQACQHMQCRWFWKKISKSNGNVQSSFLVNWLNHSSGPEWQSLKTTSTSCAQIPTQRTLCDALWQGMKRGSQPGRSSPRESQQSGFMLMHCVQENLSKTLPWERWWWQFFLIVKEWFWLTFWILVRRSLLKDTVRHWQNWRRACAARDPTFGVVATSSCTMTMQVPTQHLTLSKNWSNGKSAHLNTHLTPLIWPLATLLCSQSWRPRSGEKSLVPSKNFKMCLAKSWWACQLLCSKMQCMKWSFAGKSVQLSMGIILRGRASLLIHCLNALLTCRAATLMLTNSHVCFCHCGLHAQVQLIFLPFYILPKLLFYWQIVTLTCWQCWQKKLLRKNKPLLRNALRSVT